MSYIKNMNLMEYELYDLDKDISQSDNIIDNIQNAESYIRLVNIKLKEIQSHGYYWEELPALEGNQRIIKTEYNPY
jgi:hypothetical protein